MTARILIGGAIGPGSRFLGERLRQEYFSVSLCPGEAALMRELETWRPDLVLLECAPGDTALSFCQRLRTEPASRHLPLLLLVGGVDLQTRLRGLDFGADDVLDSPPEMDLLLARVQALLRSRRLRDEWRIRREDLPRLGLAADAPVPNSVAGARVLVIDDDEAGAVAVQAGLARDGALTGWAATAEQARDLCAAMAFDLLVLSLALITDDPLRIVAEFRAAEATRQIPLLLLAPPPFREFLMRGVALGADDWLLSGATGPGVTAELRARARNRLRQKFRQDRLRGDLEQAFEMALTDPLTGCYNRRHLLRKLQGLLAAPPARGLAVLLLDIDRFRGVNERVGHAAADGALLELAELLRQQVRGLDSVARIGGEEFAVVLPGCRAAEAMQTAERLRQCIERRPFVLDSAGPLSMTVSIGVVSHDGTPSPVPVTPDMLLHAARAALEEAQRRGGNAVSAASGDAPASAFPAIAQIAAPPITAPEIAPMSSEFREAT